MDGAGPLDPRLVAQPFYDRVAMYSTTVGTGTLSLGGAIIAYQTAAAAGIPNGQGVRYVIVDGPQWEVGFGQVLGTSQLTRGPQYSSNGNAAINCDGNQAVFLAPTSQDWANLQTGWLLDTITGATTLGYVTRTGNEVYGITAIPTYGAGLTFTGGVVAAAPLVGEVIATAGGPTSIYWVGMLNASVPLSGSELMLVYQGGSSRTVPASNVMLNIPSYQTASLPLTGGESVPIYQSGGNRSVPAMALMLNIPGYPPAQMPLVGQEQFVVYQAGANTSLSWTLLWNQILEQISAIGIPAQMVVGESIITAGNDGYVLLNNNGILNNVPFVGSVAATTPPANPMPGQLWWDTGGAQLYAWSGQWVIAVNPPSSTGAFLPLTGGTLSGPLVLSANATAALQAVPLQQLQTYLSLSGGSMANTASLDVGGALTPTLPAGTIDGTLIGRVVTGGSNLAIGSYADAGTTWRQLPGTGSGNTPAGQVSPAVIGASGGNINFSIGSVVADGAAVTLVGCLTLGTDLAAFPGGVNAVGYGVGSLPYPAISDNGGFLYSQSSILVPINGGYGCGTPSGYVSWSNNAGFFYTASAILSGNSLNIGGPGSGNFIGWSNINGFMYTGSSLSCWSMAVNNETSGAAVYWGFNAGYMYCPSSVMANAFVDISDPALKKQIEDAEPGALESVLAIPVKRYRFKTDSDSVPRRIGFLATDVAKVHPDAVTTTEGGRLHPDDEPGEKFQAIYSGDMTAILWQAVQELSAKVAALEAR